MVINIGLSHIGRMPYRQALVLQHTLFERLKIKVSRDQFGPATLTNCETIARFVAGIENGKLHNTNITDKIVNTKQQQNNFRIVNNAELSHNIRMNCTLGPDEGYFESGPDVSGHLLLVEHDPVYTVGLRSKDYDEGFEDRLRQSLSCHGRRADFVRTSRGGLITFHGPGQLVAYPIIYLKHFRPVGNASLKRYVALLENVIIDTLTSLGLPGAHTIREHPGVWIDGQRKIAAVGIYCNRYFTMHGLSINCNPDLFWFDQIVSCGIEDKTVTSLSEELHDKCVTIHQMIPKFMERFANYFECNFIDYDVRKDFEEQPKLESRRSSTFD